MTALKKHFVELISSFQNYTSLVGLLSFLKELRSRFFESTDSLTYTVDVIWSCRLLRTLRQGVRCKERTGRSSIRNIFVCQFSFSFLLSHPQSLLQIKWSFQRSSVVTPASHNIQGTPKFVVWNWCWEQGNRRSFPAWSLERCHWTEATSWWQLFSS